MSQDLENHNHNPNPYHNMRLHQNPPNSLGHVSIGHLTGSLGQASHVNVNSHLGESSHSNFRADLARDGRDNLDSNLQPTIATTTSTSTSTSNTVTGATSRIKKAYKKFTSTGHKSGRSRSQGPLTRNSLTAAFSKSSEAGDEQVQDSHIYHRVDHRDHVNAQNNQNETNNQNNFTNAAAVGDAGYYNQQHIQHQQNYYDRDPREPRPNETQTYSSYQTQNSHPGLFSSTSHSNHAHNTLPNVMSNSAVASFGHQIAQSLFSPDSNISNTFSHYSGTSSLSHHQMQQEADLNANTNFDLNSPNAITNNSSNHHYNDNDVNSSHKKFRSHTSKSSNLGELPQNREDSSVKSSGSKGKKGGRDAKGVFGGTEKIKKKRFLFEMLHLFLTPFPHKIFTLLTPHPNQPKTKINPFQRPPRQTRPHPTLPRPLWKKPKNPRNHQSPRPPTNYFR